VCGNQARVKKADLRHSSFTVVMQKRKKLKFASPVLNVLKLPCLWQNIRLNMFENAV
jgi:hypothetical protein